MRVILVICICVSAVTTVFSRPEESRLEKEINALETDAQTQLTDIKEILGDHPDETTRKKKSAVTTFCVEIRPQDQRTVQMCQPISDKADYNHVGPYYQQSGGYENLRPQESFSSGSSNLNKPAAAYSTPVKTYVSSGSNTESKPAPPYGPFRSTKAELSENEKLDESYSAPVRAAKSVTNEKSIDEPTKLKNEPVSHQTEEKPVERKTMESDKEVEDENDKQSPSMRAHQTEEKPVERKIMESDEEVEDENDKQSPSMRAAHPAYNYGYGSGYDQSGLVITCGHPHVAGYAHGVPGMYKGKHHRGGAAVPAYNYRSAGGAYDRPYQNYKPHPQHYGNYNQYPSRPIYRPQAHVYKGPVYSSAYLQPPVAYKPQSYPSSHSSKPIQESVESHELDISPPPQSYQPPAAYYPPAPSHGYKPYAHPVHYKPPAYSNDYELSSRAAEEENKENMEESMPDMSNKEALTIKKMEEVSEKRAEGSRFSSDIHAIKNEDERDADQGGRREHDETVGDAQGGWRGPDEMVGDGQDVWREPGETVGDAPSGWREPSEMVGDAPDGWRDAELESRSGRWRDAEEAIDWRAADQQNPNFDNHHEENPAMSNFRTSDTSQGMEEGMLSSDNQITDS